MLQWRVYYGDGSTFDSSDGEPKDAPATNVQIIIQADPDHGWYEVSRCDAYLYRDGRWFGLYDSGVMEYLISEGILRWNNSDLKPELSVGSKWIVADAYTILMYLVHSGRVKLGRVLWHDDFMKIVRAAHADPDFPEKTARYEEEPVHELE